MARQLTVFGHPLHPLLIVFPLGLLGTSTAFGIAYTVSSQPRWALVAFWMVVPGLLGGVLAAVTGFIDWLGIPSGTRAKTQGLMHAFVMTLTLILYLIAWIFWFAHPAHLSTLSFALLVAGLAVALLGGWLGGELVFRMGIGVHPGANADMPRGDSK